MAMFGREFGSKTGSGAPATASEANVQRRERLRKLALETADVTNDPYIMLNHLGSFECKLCLTLHTNEGSYLAHTQGKRHQQNLAKRNSILDKDKGGVGLPSDKKRIAPRKTVKIGRPGYKVVKQREPTTGQRSLLFQISYPKIEADLQPRYRFMGAFEQKIETPDPKFQYLLFAAEPYETIGFKIPKWDLDKSEGRLLQHWDPEKFTFTLQLIFKKERIVDPRDTDTGGGVPDQYQSRPVDMDEYTDDM